MKRHSLLFSALCLFAAPSFSHDLKLDTDRLSQRIASCEEFSFMRDVAAKFAEKHKKGAIDDYPRALRENFGNALMLDQAKPDSCQRGLLENLIEVVEYIQKAFPDRFEQAEDLRNLAEAKFLYSVRLNPGYGYRFEDADRDLRRSIAAAAHDVAPHLHVYISLANFHPPIATAAYRRATAVALHAYRHKPDADLLVLFRRAQESLIQQATGKEKQALKKQLIDVMEADKEGVFHDILAVHYSGLGNDAAAKRHLELHFASARKQFVQNYRRSLEQERHAELSPMTAHCVESMRYFYMRRKLSPDLQSRFPPEELVRSVCAIPSP